MNTLFFIHFIFHIHFEAICEFFYADISNYKNVSRINRNRVSIANISSIYNYNESCIEHWFVREELNALFVIRISKMLLDPIRTAQRMCHISQWWQTLEDGTTTVFFRISLLSQQCNASKLENDQKGWDFWKFLFINIKWCYFIFVSSKNHLTLKFKTFSWIKIQSKHFLI